MISYAEKITDTVEPMKKLKVDNLYQMISEPTAEIKAAIAHLRIIKSIDESKYKSQKKVLPYFVCAHFSPAFRRIENFAYTEYFVVDIDHLQDKGLNVDKIKDTVIKDNRVVLCFVSPSEDGLKVVFKLSEKCYDSGLYSIFYKSFIFDFSLRYGLNQVVDSKTSDVTRACFISADSYAYFNPDAETVCLRDYVDDSNPFELYNSVCQLNAKAVDAEVIEQTDRHTADPDAEALEKIKQQLNPSLKFAAKKKIAYVPQILNDIMPDISAYIANTGIVVNEVIDIQYGKKIRCRLGQKESETNVFYGNKNGFSVVETPRSGTDVELNSVVAELIENCIVGKHL